MNAPYDAQSASRYLESQVLTASQPQLQNMMLDGAIRSTTRARELWQEHSQWAQAELQLAKAADIVAALVQSAADGKADVSKRIEEEYAFLFRQLVAARVHKDLVKLDAAIELLQYERETWKLACENLNVTESDAAQIIAQQPAMPSETFHCGLDADDIAKFDGGFSLEA